MNMCRNVLGSQIYLILTRLLITSILDGIEDCIDKTPTNEIHYDISSDNDHEEHSVHELDS